MFRAIVFVDRPGDGYRVGRTLRALARFGVIAETVARTDLSHRIGREPGPIWLVRAGAWPVGRPDQPPSSCSGRPLCAFGAVAADPAWRRLLAETGGDLDQAVVPSILSVYLETMLRHALAEGLHGGRSLRAALEAAVSALRARVVRYEPLDVHHCEGLRVAQLVTSLQQGGAERVAIDLAVELPRCGADTRLFALGGPTRASFAPPPGTVDLAWEGDPDRSSRAVRLAERLIGDGYDLVHGHLLEGADIESLAETGLPLILTIHNVRAGWPAGLAELRPGQARLLVGCARAVEDDLRLAGLPAPVRTVWNGIDVASYACTPERRAAARSWRERHQLGQDDFLVLALANPRPQKRLDLLPAVLAATREELHRRGIAREARLILAGSASEGNPAAQQQVAAIRAETVRLELLSRVHSIGSVDDVPGLLAAVDVLVSASTWEGMSLAYIEALASGLPVVATDVGGTSEIASQHGALKLLPRDAPPQVFARALAEVAAAGPPGGQDQGIAHLSRDRMAADYARLFRRAILGTRPRGEGLLLITNNFSTGGAQSSARRLLQGLAARGVRVRAATLQEQTEFPTPGRLDLVAHGIPVLALPPPIEIDPSRAVEQLLEQIDDDPPATVLLWNVMVEHKLLLADGLVDIPIFDVSPGEMYFASLERYFASPRRGLAYRDPADYGARLEGVIVKYAAEAARAEAMLRVPVHVIPNGVPVDERGAGEDSGARGASGGEPTQRQPIAIGTLARIAPQKRLEDLIEAWQRAAAALPGHVLRIAGGVEQGSDAYAAALRARRDGSEIEWVGELNDPTAFVESLDLFVMISEPAGCPNASLEAMAAGLPVVATDVGGAGEQIEDGVTGRLVAPRDPEAFAKALLELARDAGLRSRLGRAARQRVAERFDIQRMVAEYQRVCLGGKDGE